MIPPVIDFRELALRVNCAPELATPDHQRFQAGRELLPFRAAEVAHHAAEDEDETIVDLLLAAERNARLR